MSQSRDEKAWAEEWARQEARLEEELEEALARLRALKGVKKRLAYKAVVNYIWSMVRDG